MLDNFNRGNANNLGANWSQPNNNIRLNGNNAQHNNGNQGFAYWNGTTAGGPTYGTVQGAAFTLANAAAANNNGNSLILKATGGTANESGELHPCAGERQQRHRWSSRHTNNAGGNFTTLGSFPAAGNFANGDTLTAGPTPTGRSTCGETPPTSVRASTVTTFTGTGRIGMQLTNGARVDNFSGGTLP